MSEWGPWGPCSKKRKLCGFKKGNEDRTRRILQAPSGDVSLCPATTEVRRCTVQKNQCPEGEQRWSVSPSLPTPYIDQAQVLSQLSSVTNVLCSSRPL